LFAYFARPERHPGERPFCRQCIAKIMNFGGVQLIDAERKMSVAPKPRAERTACNLPHFSTSDRLVAPPTR
jgi:hypothetical protein